MDWDTSSDDEDFQPPEDFARGSESEGGADQIAHRTRSRYVLTAEDRVPIAGDDDLRDGLGSGRRLGPLSVGEALAAAANRSSMVECVAHFPSAMKLQLHHLINASLQLMYQQRVSAYRMVVKAYVNCMSRRSSQPTFRKQQSQPRARLLVPGTVSRGEVVTYESSEQASDAVMLVENCLTTDRGAVMRVRDGVNQTSRLLPPLHHDLFRALALFASAGSMLNQWHALHQASVASFGHPTLYASAPPPTLLFRSQLSGLVHVESARIRARLATAKRLGMPVSTTTVGTALGRLASNVMSGGLRGFWVPVLSRHDVATWLDCDLRGGSLSSLQQLTTPSVQTITALRYIFQLRPKSVKNISESVLAQPSYRDAPSGSSTLSARWSVLVPTNAPLITITDLREVITQSCAHTWQRSGFTTGFAVSFVPQWARLPSITNPAASSSSTTTDTNHVLSSAARSGEKKSAPTPPTERHQTIVRAFTPSEDALLISGLRRYGCLPCTHSEVERWRQNAASHHSQHLLRIQSRGTTVMSWQLMKIMLQALDDGKPATAFFALWRLPLLTAPDWSKLQQSLPGRSAQEVRRRYKHLRQREVHDYFRVREKTQSDTQPKQSSGPNDGASRKLKPWMTPQQYARTRTFRVNVLVDAIYAASTALAALHIMTPPQQQAMVQKIVENRSVDALKLSQVHYARGAGAAGSGAPASRHGLVHFTPHEIFHQWMCIRMQYAVSRQTPPQLKGIPTHNLAAARAFTQAQSHRSSRQRRRIRRQQQQMQRSTPEHAAVRSWLSQDFAAAVSSLEHDKDRHLHNLSDSPPYSGISDSGSEVSPDTRQRWRRRRNLLRSLDTARGAGAHGGEGGGLQQGSVGVGESGKSRNARSSTQHPSDTGPSIRSSGGDGTSEDATSGLVTRQRVLDAIRVAQQKAQTPSPSPAVDYQHDRVADGGSDEAAFAETSSGSSSSSSGQDSRDGGEVRDSPGHGEGSEADGNDSEPSSSSHSSSSAAEDSSSDSGAGPEDSAEDSAQDSQASSGFYSKFLAAVAKRRGGGTASPSPADSLHRHQSVPPGASHEDLHVASSAGIHDRLKQLVMARRSPEVDPVVSRTQSLNELMKTTVQLYKTMQGVNEAGDDSEDSLSQSDSEQGEDGVQWGPGFETLAVQNRMNKRAHRKYFDYLKSLFSKRNLAQPQYLASLQHLKVGAKRSRTADNTTPPQTRPKKSKTGQSSAWSGHRSRESKSNKAGPQPKPYPSGADGSSSDASDASVQSKPAGARTMWTCPRGCGSVRIPRVRRERYHAHLQQCTHPYTGMGSGDKGGWSDYSNPWALGKLTTPLSAWRDWEAWFQSQQPQTPVSSDTVPSDDPNTTRQEPGQPTSTTQTAPTPPSHLSSRRSSRRCAVRARSMLRHVSTNHSQRQLRDQQRVREAIESFYYPPSKRHGCWCKQPFMLGKPYLLCGECNLWKHAKCYGIPDNRVRSLLTPRTDSGGRERSSILTEFSTSWVCAECLSGAPTHTVDHPHSEGKDSLSQASHASADDSDSDGGAIGPTQRIKLPVGPEGQLVRTTVRFYRQQDAAILQAKSVLCGSLSGDGRCSCEPGPGAPLTHTRQGAVQWCLEAGWVPKDFAVFLTSINANMSPAQHGNLQLGSPHEVPVTKLTGEVLLQAVCARYQAYMKLLQSH